MSNSSLPPKSGRWGTRILLVLFAAVVAPVGAAIFYTYPPTQYTYWFCVFHKITGLHCPGCGGTRCVHALLHGNIEQALAYNPLVVLASPLLAYSFCGLVYTMWTGQRMPGPRLPAWAAKFVLGVVLLYWIARNIDVYPLNLLAPHQI